MKEFNVTDKDIENDLKNLEADLAEEEMGKVPAEDIGSGKNKTKLTTGKKQIVEA